MPGTVRYILDSLGIIFAMQPAPIPDANVLSFFWNVYIALFESWSGRARNRQVDELIRQK